MSDIDLIKKLPPEPATEKQFKYLRALAEQHDDTAMVKAMPDQWKHYYWAALNGDDKIAKTDASKFITELLKCPKRQKCGPAGDPCTDVGPVGEFNFGYNQHLPLPQVELEDGMLNRDYIKPPSKFDVMQPLEDGMYRRIRECDDTFYKVYHTVHGNNVQVAKRLIITQSGTLTKSGANDSPITAKVKFKYEGRAPLKFLTPEMRLTIEEAKEFGALYGTCCICGRTLTNELSIHIGIGPVCGKRQFGGEFEFQIQQAKLELGQDNYPHGMSATGAPLSEQELQARLAEINQELGE